MRHSYLYGEEMSDTEDSEERCNHAKLHTNLPSALLIAAYRAQIFYLGGHFEPFEAPDVLVEAIKSVI